MRDESKSGVTCRGSYLLGSACGKCERCLREEALMRQPTIEGAQALAAVTPPPGLPTVAQVMEHSKTCPLPEGGGAWLFKAQGKEPGIIALRAVAGGMEMRNMSGTSWIWFMPATWAAYTASPCDQHGHPLPLVEERDRYRKEAERLACEAGILEEELDRLRRGDLEDARARLSQAARRVLELETDAAMLGHQDTPEGKALRALVGAAAPHVEHAMHVETSLLGSMIATRAESETDLDVAASCLAVLLTRREEGQGGAAPTAKAEMGLRSKVVTSAHEPGDDETTGDLECPCCGGLAARGDVRDGDALLCGCSGWVSLDSGTPAYVVLGHEPCPDEARCWARMIEGDPGTDAAARRDNLDITGKRHSVDEAGDCVFWCRACHENMRAGLNPDGTAPDADDTHRRNAQTLKVIDELEPPDDAGRAAFDEIIARDKDAPSDGRTCGQCRHWMVDPAESALAVCGHPDIRGASEYLQVVRIKEPPDDCPGFEPMEKRGDR